jgi:hypothetical protein
MPTKPKPMRPVERQLRLAGVALADAKRCHDPAEIQRWRWRIDELLDEFQANRSVETTARQPEEVSV